jgi:tetratricopeptide (TPR) repeat protein
MLLRERGDQEGALAGLVQACSCPGAGAEVHYNLGVLRWQRREVRLAIEAFRRTVALEPRFGQAWQALGLAHRSLNENAEALDALRRATACEPGNPATHAALGRVLLDLNMSDAVAPLARAAALAPKDPAIADEYAQALAAAGEFDAALLEHARARTLSANAIRFRLSHARTLATAGRDTDAAQIYHEVIAQPDASPADKAAAHFQLAVRGLIDGDIAAARAGFDAALKLTPDDAGIRLHRGMLLLSLGEFEQGWQDFEARFAADMRSGGILAQPFPQPRWDGSDLSAKTILVWGEQGIGDDIILASLIPDLAKAAARVLLHCDARLVPIFARSLPANVVCYPRIAPIQAELLSPEVDWQIPLGSLGRHLRPDWASFGEPTAYLRADPEKVGHFRRRYAALPGLKVGIAWRSRNLVNGRFKSSNLAEWGPIFRTPGISFVNLQYGDCAGDLSRVSRDFGVDVLTIPEVDQLADMDAFAAQVAALDLVVATSGVIAHTAGALGVPTFALLPKDPLWVWFRGRDNSPWYPRVRLFRQIRSGDWTAPIGAVADNLRAYARG